MDAPQIVVGQLLFCRSLEGGHLHALGVDSPEYSADGAVLAAGIHGLEDDEQGVFALGPHDGLQFTQAILVAVK